MNFNPDDAKRVIEYVRDAFNRAAQADSGASQRTFKKMASSIEGLSNMLEKSNGRSLDPRMIFMLMDLQKTATQLKEEVQNNPQAAAVFKQLMSEIQDDLKDVLPGLGNLPPIPGLPKLPGMDFGLPKNPPKPPTPPAPKGGKPPRKPGDGFKF